MTCFELVIQINYKYRNDCEKLSFMKIAYTSTLAEAFPPDNPLSA